ncbi:hypothetical protein Taro_017745 [Colocasia esculenta]|uniref:Uncharacterized protein n=1 Tax=Colocasia esculenta TaxID=4460 RepID=A0A843UGY7_COLES|nr:hypothetical protein [Colocasia esculenta]
MFKFLKGVVGGSGSGPKDLPYNIGEPYSSAWGSWTHHRGTSKEVMLKMDTLLLVAMVSSVFGRSSHLPYLEDDGEECAASNPGTDPPPPEGSASKAVGCATGTATLDCLDLEILLETRRMEGQDDISMWKVGSMPILSNIAPISYDIDVDPNVCGRKDSVNQNSWRKGVVVTQTLDWKLHAFDVLSEFDTNIESGTSPMLFNTLPEIVFGKYEIFMQMLTNS